MSDAVCRHVQCTPIDQRHVKCTHIHISTPSLSPSTPNVRQPRGEWEWERKKGRQGASARKAGKARRKDRLEVCWRCLGSTGWRCLGSHCPATMALPAPVAQQQVCTLDALPYCLASFCSRFLPLFLTLSLVSSRSCVCHLSRFRALSRGLSLPLATLVRLHS